MAPRFGWFSLLNYHVSLSPLCYAGSVLFVSADVVGLWVISGYRSQALTLFYSRGFVGIQFRMYRHLPSC